ncbi:MAG: hypothetical protein JNN07_28610 [Verrucomicrobiales bacterium]|nr:hypothetical protein [Verrucomicrobiales bacterium]
MHTETVERELGEALVHLQDLVAEFQAGKIQSRDEPALAVQLGHILDHISVAWNCKDLTPDQIAGLSQVDFERLSNTVPNFTGGRVLGEFALG